VRILHAISGIDPRNGGPTNALIGLAAAQRSAGLDVRVVSTWQEKDAIRSAEQLEKLGVGVQMIGPATGALSRHPDIRRLIDQEVAGADVVHVHALWEELQHQAARSAQRQGKPYLIRPCGMLDPWSLSQSRWKKRLYMALRLRRNLDRAAALHFTSELERDLTAPLKLKPRGIVEPNGIRVEEFEPLPPPGQFRQRHPELRGRPLLMFLSRLHLKKGLDILIPALARLRRRDAVLVLAGPDGDGYGQTVQRMVEESKLQDRVIFVGMLRGADRIAALADADLFVLPSYQENFGIAVIEALAAGTPVVVSDQVNIYREIASAGVGGVVPTRVEPLAEEIDRWLADESLRRAAAERARPFVWQHYDWNQIARRWIGHYTSITGANRP
jgi:glycosyltransferase involved in cell wall biosynthesis